MSSKLVKRQLQAVSEPDHRQVSRSERLARKAKKNKALAVARSAKEAHESERKAKAREESVKQRNLAYFSKTIDFVGANKNLMKREQSITLHRSAPRGESPTSKNGESGSSRETRCLPLRTHPEGSAGPTRVVGFETSPTSVLTRLGDGAVERQESHLCRALRQEKQRQLQGRSLRLPRRALLRASTVLRKSSTLGNMASGCASEQVSLGAAGDGAAASTSSLSPASSTSSTPVRIPRGIAHATTSEPSPELALWAPAGLPEGAPAPATGTLLAPEMRRPSPLRGAPEAQSLLGSGLSEAESPSPAPTRRPVEDKSEDPARPQSPLPGRAPAALQRRPFLQARPNPATPTSPSPSSSSSSGASCTPPLPVRPPVQPRPAGLRGPSPATSRGASSADLLAAQAEASHLSAEGAVLRATLSREREESARLRDALARLTLERDALLREVEGAPAGQQFELEGR